MLFRVRQHLSLARLCEFMLRRCVVRSLRAQPNSWEHVRLQMAEDADCGSLLPDVETMQLAIK